MDLRFEVEKDGSFSVCHGDEVILENCYPGINGENVRPLQIRINPDKTKIMYDTRFGILLLDLQIREDELIIASKMERPKAKDSDRLVSYSPIQGAGIKKTEGIYRVSGETGDESGYLSKKDLDDIGKCKSAGLCPVLFADGTVTLFFADYRTFELGFEIQVQKEISAVQSEMFRVTAGMKTAGYMKEEILFPELHFIWTADVQKGLEFAGKQIVEEMKIKLDKPTSYNWCSWYYCYHDFDEVQLKEYLEGFQKIPGAGDIRYFLIDAGYCRSLGDWLDMTPRWKSGLKEAMQEIGRYGYKPAIWIGPYMVGNRSRLYHEHPDWILHRKNGDKVRMLITDNEPKLWDYQDEEYYVLDTSHPEAFRYMKDVFETLHSWGACMFKTDFMVWGLQDSENVKRYCPGKTSVEYFRDFLEMIRETIGQESYWLGCIAPFFPFLGYADGMRIGGDVGSCWNASFGPKNMIQAVMGNLFMNHVFFENDPDVVMLRDFHIRMNDREIKSLALFQAVAGGSIYTSDPVHLIGEIRQELFRFIQPGKKRKAEAPFAGQNRKERVLVQKSRDCRKALLFVLNPEEEEISVNYGFEELELFMPQTLYPVSAAGMCGMTQEMGMWGRIAAHGHLLLYLSADREKVMKKKNIWEYLGD